MTYVNTEQLKKWLEDDKFPEWNSEQFDIQAAEYEKHLKSLESGSRPESEHSDAAAYRCLTFDKPRRTPAVSGVIVNLSQIHDKIAVLETQVTYARQQAVSNHAQLLSSVNRLTKRVLIVGGVIILLILASATLGYSQNTNPAIVVATCGTPPAVYPTAGQRAPETVNTDGELCAGVSVSATIATAGLAISVSVGASSSGVPVTPTGGVVSTSAPTWADGTIAPFSFETDGDLRVAASVTPPALQNVNLTQIGSANVIASGLGAVAVVGAVSSGTTALGGPVIMGALSGTAAQSLSTSITNGGLNANVVNTVTVTDGSGALNVIVDSSALPTGAATEATLALALTSANFAAAFGTAGTADAQVMSIQGIASMTPVTVTDGSGALNVIVDSSALPTGAATEATLALALTSANFAAAFGTAGTADTQVMSIQGIASMTPIQVNVTTFGSTAVTTSVTGGTVTTAGGIVGAVTPTGLTDGSRRSLMLDGSGAVRTTVSNAISGYLSVVSATSSVINGASGPTDAALVTVGATQRVVVHQVEVKCGSTVTNAITAAIGLGAANVPASGAGRISAMPATTASQFQGFVKGVGFPNILAVGAAGEDLRYTQTNPSAGACEVSWVTTVEPA